MENPVRRTMVKFGSLSLLVGQTAATVVVMRYSRIAGSGQKYLTSVAVMLAELFKVPACVLVIILTEGFQCLKESIYEDILMKKKDTLKVGVPALCYTVQNNLLFIALSNLQPATFQVLYQTKTLCTAFFMVTILKRALLGTQWLALLALVVGVVIVQLHDLQPVQKTDSQPTSPMLGVTATLVSAALSGFAGVYFEALLKHTHASLWIRNLQMSIFTVPMAVSGVLMSDFRVIQEQGLLVGFSSSAVAVVVLNTLGGLIVAMVIKYADNILKTYASVFAIVLTSLVSIPLFDAQPSKAFAIGVCCIFVSVYLYALPVKATEKVPQEHVPVSPWLARDNCSACNFLQGFVGSWIDWISNVQDVPAHDGDGIPQSQPSRAGAAASST